MKSLTKNFSLILTFTLLISTSAMAENIDNLLIEAVVKGDQPKVVQLIEDGANPNASDYQGNSVLLIASEWGRATIAQVLIENGANKNVKNRQGESPMDIAEAMEYKRLMKVLQTANASKKKVRTVRGKSIKISKLNRALMKASEEGNIQKVVYLVKRGANINVQDELGNTPLMYASQWGRATVIKYLIQNGAMKDIRNKSGKTAYDILLNTEYDRALYVYNHTKLLKNPSSKLSSSK